MIFVGKSPHGESGAQEGIAAEMVRRARLGQTVVRLKGGDPFVFGRGGEEAQALTRADVPFEVVPGITSAIAVPAYAGIPVTHREVASSFTVVSGSEDPGKEESLIDWKALASGGGTLVLLMGWESLGGICKTLKENGMSADTPAALIQWGTRPGQRVVEGTLDTVLGPWQGGRIGASHSGRIRPGGSFAFGDTLVRQQAFVGKTDNGDQGADADQRHRRPAQQGRSGGHRAAQHQDCPPR